MDQKVEVHLACSINNSYMEIKKIKKTKDGTSDGTLPSPTQERIR